MKRNLTLTYGLRYVRDTGRTDSDLAAIPVLNQFGAGLGNRVNQPNLNFAPQVGVAWDPGKAGKTVLRAGIGLFYENSIWNNELFDRPPRLASGLFLIDQTVCSNGTGSAFTLPNGQVQNWAPICGQPIAQLRQPDRRSPGAISVSHSRRRSRQQCGLYRQRAFRWN